MLLYGTNQDRVYYHHHFRAVDMRNWDVIIENGLQLARNNFGRRGRRLGGFFRLVGGGDQVNRNTNYY